MHRRKWHSIYKKPILGSFSSKRKQGGGGWCSSWRKRWSKKRGFHLELEKLPLVNTTVKIIQGKMENSRSGREGEGTLAHRVVRQRADCFLCQLLQCPISGSFMEGSIHLWLCMRSPGKLFKRVLIQKPHSNMLCGMEILTFKSSPDGSNVWPKSELLIWKETDIL